MTVRRRRLAAGGRSGSHRALFGWVALLALFLAGCAAELPQDALNPAGPVARRQDDLWNMVFPIAVGVFFLVQGMLLVAVFRFRRRPGDDDTALPKQVAGNTRLEIVWTIIPAIILAGVAIPTVQTIFELSGRPDGDALEVRVVGKQYWWEFEYLGEEGQGVVTASQLHIPVDRPVYLRMESLSANAPDPGEVGVKTGQVAQGVVHSFWVPRLAGKQDVVPGHVRELTIQADEPGRYEGQCAEFCGLSHARMRFQVIAQTPDEFQGWLDAQAQPADNDLTGLAAEGHDLFAVNCISCHAVEGFQATDGSTPPEMRWGPNLTHLQSRDTFAGGFLELNDENLAAWLRNPQAQKAGAQMPNLGLSEEQIEALVAYLNTLE